MADTTFGDLLRQLRRERGLSLRGLSRRVHYSHSYLWDIETGLKPPTRKLAALVDTALDTGGQLVALVADEPASVSVGRGMALHVRELAQQGRPAGERPVSLRDASQWAQLATWCRRTGVCAQARTSERVHLLVPAKNDECQRLIDLAQRGR